MPTTLGDLDAYFSPGLELTVRGKGYTVPLASAELGLWCRTIAEATGAVSEDSSPEEMRQAVSRLERLPQLPGEMSLAQRLLGSAYDEMVSDQVPDVYIEFCSATAYIWIIAGEEQAQRYWESGGRPEARRPGNRADRRAEAKAGVNGTAAASGTPSPASTSGTRSRKRSRRPKSSR